MHRRLATFVVAAALLATVACSGSKGSKDEFCAALPRTLGVMGILGDFGTDNSSDLEQRVDTGLAEFRTLEKKAPRQIRSDVAKVGDAVAKLLDAVRANPNDTAAIRNQLAGDAAQLAAAGKSAQKLRDYAVNECRIDVSTTTGPSATTGSIAPATTG